MRAMPGPSRCRTRWKPPRRLCARASSISKQRTGLQDALAPLELAVMLAPMDNRAQTLLATAKTRVSDGYYRDGVAAFQRQDLDGAIACVGSGARRRSQPQERAAQPRASDRAEAEPAAAEIGSATRLRSGVSIPAARAIRARSSLRSCRAKAARVSSSSEPAAGLLVRAIEREHPKKRGLRGGRLPAHHRRFALREGRVATESGSQRPGGRSADEPPRRRQATACT